MKRLLFVLLLLSALAAQAHAALDVAVLRRFYSGTASSATWLRIDLPPHTASVLIEVDGAAWVDGTGGSYTDGGGRSSGGRAITVGETLVLPVRDSTDDLPIWVAGNGGSRTVTVIALGSEAR